MENEKAYDVEIGGKKAARGLRLFTALSTAMEADDLSIVHVVRGNRIVASYAGKSMRATGDALHAERREIADWNGDL